MNLLKKMVNFFIGTILSLLIFIFTFSFVFKNVVQKQIIGETVKTIVVNEYIKDSDIENKEKLEELLEDNDANKLIDIISNEFGNSIDEDNYQVDQSTIESIIDICVDHKDEISEIAGRTITEDEIRSIETKNNLKEAFDSGFEKINENVNDTSKKVINGYTKLISTKFRIIICVSILIFISLLALLTKSTYKWMHGFGSSLITCGIFVILTYFSLKVIIDIAVKNLEFELNINPISILIFGVIEFIIGILFKIIYKQIDKKYEEKEQITNIK